MDRGDEVSNVEGHRPQGARFGKEARRNEIAFQHARMIRRPFGQRRCEIPDVDIGFSLFLENL